MLIRGGERSSHAAPWRIALAMHDEEPGICGHLWSAYAPSQVIHRFCRPALSDLQAAQMAVREKLGAQKSCVGIQRSGDTQPVPSGSPQVREHLRLIVLKGCDAGTFQSWFYDRLQAAAMAVSQEVGARRFCISIQWSGDTHPESSSCPQVPGRCTS